MGKCCMKVEDKEPEEVVEHGVGVVFWLRDRCEVRGGEEAELDLL